MHWLANHIRSLSILRGRKVFEPPRFMTIAQAAGQLLEAIEGRRKEGKPLQCEWMGGYLVAAMDTISLQAHPQTADVWAWLELAQSLRP